MAAYTLSAAGTACKTFLEKQPEPRFHLPPGDGNKHVVFPFPQHWTPTRYNEATSILLSARRVAANCNSYSAWMGSGRMEKI